MEPRAAIWHYALGKLSSQSMVGLANSWLEQEIYTDSLNYITMERDPVIADVGPLLESVIKDLG